MGERKEFASPDGLFRKKIVKEGVGFFVPIDGAICKIESILDENELIKQLDFKNTKEVIIGEADEHIDLVLESCISTMKEDETAEIYFLLPSSGCKKADSPSKEAEVKEVEKDVDDIEEMKSPVVEEKDSELESSLDSDQIENELDNKVAQEITDSIAISKESLNSEVPVQSEKSPCIGKNKSVCDDSSSSEIELKSFCDGLPVEKVSVVVRLIAFTRQPEIWEMSVTEKWRRAIRHKERGVELYAKGRHGWAFRRFSVAIKYLISVEHDIPPEHLEKEVDVKGLKLSCYLNIAACHLKKPNYELAVKVCSKALELDAYNAKALYRRASAFIHLQEYDKAEEDLKRAAELEPTNSAILKQQKVLKGKVQKLNNFYAKAMKKMFT